MAVLRDGRALLSKKEKRDQARKKAQVWSEQEEKDKLLRMKALTLTCQTSRPVTMAVLRDGRALLSKKEKRDQARKKAQVWSEQEEKDKLLIMKARIRSEKEKKNKLLPSTSAATTAEKTFASAIMANLALVARICLLFSVLVVFVALVDLGARTFVLIQSSIGGQVSFAPPGSTAQHAPTFDGLKSEPTIVKANCPAGSLFMDGVVHSCLDPFESVADSGAACFLSDEDNSTLARVEATLTKWTVRHKCGFHGCQLARASVRVKGPVFALIDVEAVDEQLLAKSNKLVVFKDEDGANLVGFSDNYMNNELALPWLCRLFLFFVPFVQAILTLTVDLLHSSRGVVWSVGVAYPLKSVLCILILGFLRYLRVRKIRRQALLCDVAHVRTITYRMLREDSMVHIVLHLRDEVAFDLHPTSAAGRSYIVSKVWPRLVHEVRRDNRVRKTNQLWMGIPRDSWQWVALRKNNPGVMAVGSGRV